MSIFLRQSIKAAIAEYLECVSSLKSKSSQELEKIFLSDLEIFFNGKSIELLSDVSPRHSESLQASLLKSKKTSTINRQFTVYKHFFEKCVSWKFLSENPFQHTKKLREINPEIKVMDNCTIKSILYSSEGWFFRAFKFLAITGCRPDELKNLKIRDINLEQFRLRLFCLKNKDGFREIPFNKQEINFFKSLKESNPNPEAFVFYTSKGCRVTSDALTKKLKKICEAKGIYKYSIYSLRHSYFTNLANKGKNLESIRKLAGHQKIVTTQKYVHIDFSELQKIVNDV